MGGLFWMLSGTGIQSVLQLLVLAILARLLTPVDFGLVGAALVVMRFSNIFSQLGIGPAIVQRPNLSTTHIRTGFTITLLFGASLVALIWLLSPHIAGFFRMDGLVPVLRVIALAFFFKGLAGISESLLQRDMQFRWLAIIQVISYALGYGAVGIILALAGFGVWSLVLAYLAQEILISVMAMIAMPHPKIPQLNRAAFGELMYFGGGYTIARIANFIAVQGDNLVVGRWMGAAALGLYGRAYQLMAMPATLFGQTLDKVLFPAMAKVQAEPQRLSTAYRRSIALIAMVVMPVSAVMFILAPEVINVLLGDAWLGVIAPFKILAVGMLFRSSYKMSDSLARAKGAVYRRAWRQIVYAAMVIGGAWVGQHWGLSGVAYGVLGALLINFVLMAQLSLQLTSLTWKDFIAAHGSAALLTTVVFLEAWFTAVGARSIGLAEFAILCVVLVIILATFTAMLRLAPKLFFGTDGIWLLNELAQYRQLGFLARLIKKGEVANETNPCNH
ncbi:MAG: polysaccharide biosynthesis protein [Peptococcaceae bacterium BRH_c8a]|nr:MAG: polysaccharide biosynthesis protein [Peptococcaceae bacterium BRH_c8a]